MPAVFNRRGWRKVSGAIEVMDEGAGLAHRVDVTSKVLQPSFGSRVGQGAVVVASFVSKSVGVPGLFPDGEKKTGGKGIRWVLSGFREA